MLRWVKNELRSSRTERNMSTMMKMLSTNRQVVLHSSAFMLIVGVQMRRSIIAHSWHVPSVWLRPNSTGYVLRERGGKAAAAAATTATYRIKLTAAVLFVYVQMSSWINGSRNKCIHTRLDENVKCLEIASLSVRACECVLAKERWRERAISFAKLYHLCLWACYLLFCTAIL